MLRLGVRSPTCPLPLSSLIAEGQRGFVRHLLPALLGGLVSSVRAWVFTHLLPVFWRHLSAASALCSFSM